MTPQPEASARDRIGSLIDAIRRLHHGEQRGPLAELRRMNTSGPPVSSVAQELLARLFPGWLSEHDARRLALFARILALPMSIDGLDEAHGDKGIGMGGRMLAAGISEKRVERLLLARGDAFDDQLLLVARRLANSGPLPCREIGKLILGDPATIEQTRYDIARGYWIARAANSPSAGDLQ